MAARSQAQADQEADPPPVRRPTHRLYRVQGDGAAAIWTPIGAAWPNKDGKGFSIICEAVPLTGRILLRAIPPAERGEETGDLI